MGRQSGSSSSCLCNFRSDVFESTVLAFNAVTGFIRHPTLFDSTSLSVPSDHQGRQNDHSEAANKEHEPIAYSEAKNAAIGRYLLECIPPHEPSAEMADQEET